MDGSLVTKLGEPRLICEAAGILPPASKSKQEAEPLHGRTWRPAVWRTKLPPLLPRAVACLSWHARSDLAPDAAPAPGHGSLVKTPTAWQRKDWNHERHDRFDTRKFGSVVDTESISLSRSKC